MLDAGDKLNQLLSMLTTHWRIWEQHHRIPMMILNSVLLLLVFWFQNKVFMGPLTELSEYSYNQQYMAMVFIHGVLDNLKLLAVCLATLFLVALRWSEFCSTWESLNLPQPLRIFIVFIVALMSWVSATYDYNLYLDTYHHLDRVLLLAAIPCIYWRPGFLLPYLCLLSVYLGQYTLIIGGYSWAEFSMLMGLLSLTLAVLILRTCLRRNWSVEFLLIAVCFIASHYWIAGLGKYQLDWHQLNEVSRLLSNTYANGWLAWVNQKDLSSIVRWMAKLNTPILLGTLFLEWCVFLVLWRKMTLQIFLVCWMMFHFSIFASSGIFFWKWISIEAAMLVLLHFLPQKLLLELFTLPRFVLSVLLITTSSYWSQATSLAWLDMPMTYTYIFTAETANGEQYKLPPAFFGPYDYQFTLSKFDYLSKHRILSIAWGATSNKNALLRANKAKTVADVLTFETEYGAVRYDEDRTKSLVGFLIKFSEAFNREGGKPEFYSFAKAPRQLWTFPDHTAIPSGSTIKSIQIDQLLTFFDGYEYMEIVSRPVHTVHIDDTPI